MQAEELGILVVCYENLVELGQSEWLRILSALDLQVMPDEKLVLQPSQQAWGEKARDSALVRQHASWMEHIDQKMLDRIQRVLDATGMDVYSVHQALPTKNL
jgi:hypothetical protein